MEYTEGIYVWAKWGYPLSDEQACRLWGVLESIPKEERNAQRIVEEARPETSSIHDLFEWDNDIAAEKYRLSQARTAIKAIEVAYVDENVEARDAYFSVSKSETQVYPRNYLRHDEISNDERSRKEICRRAANDVLSFQNRYRDYREWFAEYVPELLQILDIEPDDIWDWEDY